MTRPLDAEVAAAVGLSQVYLAILVECQFAPEDLLVWSGIGPFSWNNKTFGGAGELLSIGATEETIETRAVSIAIGLTGVPTDLIGFVQEVNWRGRPANIWLALLNPNGGLLGDPIQVLGGRMDVLSWSEGDTATITLTVESKLADLDRARVRRYTDRDQENEYPGDLGFQYVESIQDTVILWGKGVTT